MESGRESISPSNKSSIAASTTISTTSGVPELTLAGDNIDYIAFTGIEASVQFQLPRSSKSCWPTPPSMQIRIAARPHSKYVFNYPSHNGSFVTGESSIGQRADAVGTTQRVGTALTPSGMRCLPQQRKNPSIPPTSNLSNTG